VNIRSVFVVGWPVADPTIMLLVPALLLILTHKLCQLLIRTQAELVIDIEIL